MTSFVTRSNFHQTDTAGTLMTFANLLTKKRCEICIAWKDAGESECTNTIISGTIQNIEYCQWTEHSTGNTSRWSPEIQMLDITPWLFTQELPTRAYWK